MVTFSPFPDPAPPPGQHALTMLALEPAPPLLADLRPALEPESPVALDAQGYRHSTPAPAPGEGPPPGTVLEPQSAPESPCPCPGTVQSQHTEELPDITTFPPRLLAEQLTLIDAVSSWALQAVRLAPAVSDQPLPEEQPMPWVQFQPHFLPTMGSG